MNRKRPFNPYPGHVPSWEFLEFLQTYKLTDKAFAEWAGITPSRVRNYVNGAKIPDYVVKGMISYIHYKK